MSNPFVSLNAASSTGPGESSDLGLVAVQHTMQVVVSGAPDTFTVTLEGSLDGSNWVTLGTYSKTSQGVSGSPLTTVNTSLVRYVRANLTGLSGGSSPTVTVLIASNLPSAGLKSFSGTFA